MPIIIKIINRHRRLIDITSLILFCLANVSFLSIGTDYCTAEMIGIICKDNISTFFVNLLNPFMELGVVILSVIGLFAGQEILPLIPMFLIGLTLLFFNFRGAYILFGMILENIFEIVLKLERKANEIRNMRIDSENKNREINKC